MTRIAVLGAGSWGTAMAVHLTRRGHQVVLWGRDAEAMARMARERRNARYLPDVLLSADLHATASLTEALADAETAFVAVPCQALRGVLERAYAVRAALPPLVLLGKGIEAGTLLLPHQVAMAVAGDDLPCAVLSGPTFAADVARGLPSAAVMAGTDAVLTRTLQRLVHGDGFRVYASSDPIGVALAGALKNVMAIAAGVADGLGYGANTRAALVTRGLAEMRRLGVAMGGSTQTFMGLAGLGDLVLTSTDDQSRNRRLGLALGAGGSREEALARIGQVVEGERTARHALALGQRHAVELPITAQVVAVLDGQCMPREAVHALLSREPREEQD